MRSSMQGHVVGRSRGPVRAGAGLRAAAAVTALLLVAAGCASDREGSDPDAEAGDDSASTGLPTENFGDLAVPCGDGDASGATDQGVTDDTITIGYGDDSGYSAAPGLNEEMGDAIDAAIAWCNSLGGINGRELVGNRYDAALNNAAQVGVEACSQDFALVGQGFAFDENMEADRIACQLVSVPGFVVSPAATHGPMTYQPIPNPVDVYGPSREQIVVDNVEGADNLAVVGRDNNAAAVSSRKTIAAYEAAGANVLDCGVVVKSAGGDNYPALVRRLEDCGAEMLIDTATPSPPMYAFLDALKLEGFEGSAAFGTPWYAQSVLQANVGGNTEGLYVGMNFNTFENAEAAQAVADYLAVVEANDGKTGLLGMQAFSAFLLWAGAADACESDLTRQCLVDQLSQVTDWTGGGLHSNTNPGENLPAKCAILVQVQGGEFVQVAPEATGEFECYEDYLDLPQSTWGVELNEDRLATTYLTDDIITPSS
jgi:ABC-type branched-subunit amino acid transport system substrate-binding protein